MLRIVDVGTRAHAVARCMVSVGVGPSGSGVVLCARSLLPSVRRDGRAGRHGCAERGGDRRCRRRRTPPRGRGVGGACRPDDGAARPLARPVTAGRHLESPGRVPAVRVVRDVDVGRPVPRLDDVAVAILVGSCVVQIHAGYIPLVAPLLVLAVGFAVVELVRSRRTSSRHARSTVTRVLLVVGAVALLIWSPVLVQQLFGANGNLHALLSYIRHPTESTAGWRTAFGAFGLEFRPVAAVGRRPRHRTGIDRGRACLARRAHARGRRRSWTGRVASSANAISHGCVPWS